MGYYQNKYNYDYNLAEDNSLELKDYERHCESLNNKIVRSGSDRFYTNCVLPGHDDKNPSLVIKKGDRRVIFSCLSGCDRDELTSYFKKALGGL